MSLPLLKIDGLSIGYEGADGVAVPIVNQVDLQLEEGSTLGLVGESGCGKSTLLLALMGYYDSGLARLAGKVALLGKDPGALNEADLQLFRGGDVALIPQNAGQALTPTLKIEAQMLEALRLHTPLPAASRQDRILQLFDRVQLPDPANLLGRYPHELSGGQQQRVALAMALAGNPKVLLLDEPTTGLDVTTQQAVLVLLSEIALESQTAMVFVSHDIGVIGAVCERVAVMYAGEIVELGACNQILQHPRHPYTQALLSSIPKLGQARAFKAPTSIQQGQDRRLSGCAYAPRCEYVGPTCLKQKPRLTRDQDREVKCVQLSEIAGMVAPAGGHKGESKMVGQEYVLSVNNLSVSYDHTGWWPFASRQERKLTVREVSFDIVRGQTLGLVGESGSGKSSILRTLIGLQKSFEGAALLLDKFDLTTPVAHRSKACLSKIQMVFQNPDASLNPRQSIFAALARPLRIYFRLSEPEIRAEVERLMAAVQLPMEYSARYPGQLSGGERQRVAIARALASKPDVLLCDEITSALDVSVQASIIQLLKDLKDAQGLTLLFVSHDLPVVMALADDVAILQRGQICESGRVEQIFNAPEHPYTQSLIKAVL